MSLFPPLTDNTEIISKRVNACRLAILDLHLKPGLIHSSPAVSDRYAWFIQGCRFMAVTTHHKCTYCMDLRKNFQQKLQKYQSVLVLQYVLYMYCSNMYSTYVIYILYQCIIQSSGFSMAVSRSLRFSSWKPTFKIVYI